MAVSTGASLTLVRLIVITAVSLKAGVPLSVTVTFNVKLGVVSIFSRLLLVTVIWRVVAFTANAAWPVPPVTAKVGVFTGLRAAVATMVPTTVPLALFSATENG